MINKFVDGAILIIPETQIERGELVSWSHQFARNALSLMIEDEGAVRIQSLGPAAEVFREPINIVFDKTPAPLNLISNLAPTPFHMDGMHYASIEGFWQGLKFADEDQRRRIAALDRHSARNAGAKAPRQDMFNYRGREIRAGTYDHWQLMEGACRAKFSQHLPAREALIATGARPLTHKVTRDSRTIPGVIVAEIWMCLRDDIQGGRL